MTVLEKPQLNLTLRVGIAAGVVVFFFVILGLRLWYLQILRGESFRFLSENNRLRSVYIPAPRGRIFDRNGKILVKNRPALNIEMVFGDAPDVRGTLSKLGTILGEDPQELYDRLDRYRRRRRVFEPQIVLADVDRDVVARVAARRYELPGVIVSVNPARDYIFGEFAAHVIGYIREISRSQLESPNYASYRMGDLVGQYGIEARFEQYLQGNRGKQRVVVNAIGTRISEYSYDEEVPGHDLELTLDFAVQRAADQALQGKHGAIVALNPQTGEVYAMSSAPAFDPNIFTREMTRREWTALLGGREKRLNNRAVQGGFPPGSVFKIIMAVAGLSEGVISPGEQVHCPGHFYVGRARFHCHKRVGHGPMNLFLGLVKSCDVYFYTVGQRLGIDRIHDWAVKFGLGRPTGLELVEENTGLVPSTAWKQKYFRKPEDQKWYPGETPSVAIGQGALVATPLQMARAVSALVNNGKLLRPYLVKRILTPEGVVKDDSFGLEVESEFEIAPEIRKVVMDALTGVVHDGGGTGRRARLDESLGIKVAGKTGTSQVVSLSADVEGEEFEDHGWFVGYAPAEEPEILVVAVHEHGGSGGRAAAPMVKQVLEAYFGVLPPEAPTPEASTDAD